MRSPQLSHVINLVIMLVMQVVCVGVTKAFPNQQSGEMVSADNRKVVFISDLHFGVGQRPDGSWDPTEDFRWSSHLSSFLKEIGSWGEDRVDLVILGDLLELWQPPKSWLEQEDKCKSKDKDQGCTIAALTELTKRVTRAHSKDIQALSRFAMRGTNHLFIVPGNHDAALLNAGVWKEVTQKMVKGYEKRVTLVKEGIWTGGKIVAEHGHQIGADVNKFENWPSVFTGDTSEKQRVVRPWGEYFVQSLYNAKERTHPIIDNLSPESAAVRYYMAEKGFWGSVADVGRFLIFNLFETSLSQKGQILGGRDIQDGWDEEYARSLGFKLIAYSLPPEDTFRHGLLQGAPDSHWEKIRTELTKVVTAKDPPQLSTEQISLLCAHMVVRASEDPDAELKSCLAPDLGAIAETAFVSRDSVLASYLNTHLEHFPEMKVFVYGHTHALEFDWEVKDLLGGTSAKIFNTGAFQRVIDNEKFLARAKKRGLTPAQALSKFDLERDLPACYSAVLGEYSLRDDPKLIVRNWYVDNKGKGSLIGACDERCASISRSCQN